MPVITVFTPAQTKCSKNKPEFNSNRLHTAYTYCECSHRHDRSSTLLWDCCVFGDMSSCACVNVPPDGRTLWWELLSSSREMVRWGEQCMSTSTRLESGALSSPSASMELKTQCLDWQWRILETSIWIPMKVGAFGAHEYFWWCSCVHVYI